ncbi:MAG: diacylglycerol kinase [Deinococcales bacterium]
MADFLPPSKTHSRALRFLELRRLLKSFGYALRGLKTAWLSEQNFRIELTLGLIALGLSLWLGANSSVIALVVALVLVLELVNSALERTIDLASPHYHQLAKEAKDITAAAVLIASILSIFIGIYELVPALWQKLQAFF